MNANNLRTVVMDVTPALAASWLEKNLCNRDLSQALVDQYAHEVRLDNWALTHQGICLTNNGEPLDGQHRLWAVVQSGITVRMMVTFGMTRELMDRIDSGRSRSLRDVLTLEGVTNAKKEQSYLRQCRLLISGNRALLPIKSRAGWTDARKPYAAGLDWATGKLVSFRLWGAAPIAGALAFCHRAWPETVARFGERLVSGAGLVHGAPELALRRHVEEAHAIGGNERARLALAKRTVGAVYAAVQGRTLMKVIEADGPLEAARAAYT